MNVLDPFEEKPCLVRAELGQETCPLPLLLHPTPHFALSQGVIECFQTFKVCSAIGSLRSYGILFFVGL